LPLNEAEFKILYYKHFLDWSCGIQVTAGWMAILENKNYNLRLGQMYHGVVYKGGIEIKNIKCGETYVFRRRLGLCVHC